MRIMSPYTLKWLHGGYEQNDISASIRDSYHQIYNASLSHCMPWLLGMYDAGGELRAACGVQTASQGVFYLEQYLDAPVETVLSSRLNLSVSREGIVEVGNFSASDGASARVMYAALCLLLNQYHYSWIVFTGTKKIRNIFHRLNLQPTLLTPASAERLGDAAQEWGEYYLHDPQVMAGELVGGKTTLSQTSILLSLFTALPDAPWIATTGEPYVSGQA
ncbi:thermostable hemolysin [Pectobacterium quasiaquaticum]|uniref:Thermostable hemolysin n=1 Tax=Pectobacterium quasiaquaticum TaxID=2774015 RepID=A0A9Q2EW53_9GAMM|nr:MULTISPECIES: thermostable hemolysin [Pectobacterium]MBE5201126.1 thermostable hemolysin [Pectobacterium quasiaquaticum]MBE5208685.1 thermostable hemolysin [Pectobacterium quasiaquaticum]MBN3064880.1 thermostable hemolysin [Pectobacterium aquaticum]URG47532.1 thermostable hemolysin [Pectobacterium quasiaquaticum]URG51304.1 thermostable hemolysin [Pectobacterium quasiaquaticum]